MFSLWANLYPSENAPYYGTFVRSAYQGWEAVLGSDNVHKCVINKPSKGIVQKLLSYTRLYLCCLFDMLFRKPSLVEIHYPFFFVPLLFLRPRHSTILRFHGSDLEKLLSSKLMLWVFNRLVSRIACIVVPSEYYRSRVVDELFYSGTVLVVAPDAVSDIFYPSTSNAIADDITIGVVGRIEKEKNVQEVIEALSMLHHQSVRLIVIGDGPYKSQLMSVAKKMGVDSRIHWVGLVPREELVFYMHKMSVFVFPSVRSAESFGLVGLEALASGVPVIARQSLLGAREYLNSKNSFSYNNSAASLSESLNRFILLSNDEKEKMREAAVSGSARFNFDEVVIGGVRRILKECDY